MRHPIAALALVATVPGNAAIMARTVLGLPAPRAGWLLCDSVDSSWAALVGKLSPGGNSDITLLAKPAGSASTKRYAVGPADAGAGQIYYSLSRGGSEVGNLHAVNPGMLDPSLPDPLNFSSISIDGHQLGCRLIDNIRLMAVTARRGVTITREAGALIYRTYDFAHPGAVIRPDGVQQTNVPTLRIGGGSQTNGSGGATSFSFANLGYTYRIDLPAGTAAGRLRVFRHGHTILSERVLGFTLVAG